MKSRRHPKPFNWWYDPLQHALSGLTDLVEGGPPPVGKLMFLSPNLDHMLLEHIEGGKLHHFKAELDGRCPGVPTEGPVRV